MENKKVILQDGSEFIGKPFGSDCDIIAELVQNTSMVGYQEIITDPAYYSKALMLTYPVIGNYGITDEDNESKQITVSALIVRDYNDMPSNFRYTKTLDEVLKDSGIPGIYGVDTRSITGILRKKGNMKCMIVSEDFPTADALLAMNYYQTQKGPVEKISCKKKWYSRTFNPKYNVAAIDCGIKNSSVKALNARGCDVTVVPYNAKADEIMSLKPDGLFISGGPGDPREMFDVIDVIRSLKGKVPILATGNGSMLVAIAYGCEVFEMKTGHHGCNHSIDNTETKTSSVEYQTHSYSIEKDSVKTSGLEITHINGFDKTVEGICDKTNGVYASCFIPDGFYDEADKGNVYNIFVSRISEVKKNA